MSERSDNIAQTAIDPKGDTINAVTVGGVVQELTADFSARLSVQAEYDEYRNNTYPDESRFGGSAYMLWTLSPQRLSWTLEDVYREIRILPGAGDVPSNRTGVNSLNTGPDFTLTLNPVNSIMLGARYGNVQFDTKDDNYNRLGGSARWLYRIGALTTLSVNYELGAVNYDNEVIHENYVRHDLFFRYATQPSRTAIVLDLGTSNIDRDHTQDSSGDLVRLSLTRQVTSDTIIGLSATHEFTDTGTDLLSGVERIGSGEATFAAQPGTLPDVLSSDVYYSRRRDAFYHFQGSSLGFFMRGFFREVDFENLPQDREELGGRVELSYAFSGLTELMAYSDYVRYNYLAYGQIDTERTNAVRMSYRVGSTTTASLEVRRSLRESTNPLVDFVDNRVLFSIHYASTPIFEPIELR